MAQNGSYLRTRAQRILKWLHVTCAAGCLGALMSIVVLHILKQSLEIERDLFYIDLSMLRISETVVTVSFFGIVFTAFIFAIFTRWGFFKHHWITVKWIGALVLLGLTWFLLGPAIGGQTALSGTGFCLEGAKQKYITYTAAGFRWALVESVLFLGIFLISYSKPWGRRREGARDRQRLKVVICSIVLAVLLGALLMQYQMLKYYRNVGVLDIDLENTPDGTYEGEADFSFVYKVAVEIKDHRIARIEVTQNRDSPYAWFAEGVIPRIIERQTANVHAVTGASTTSKCIQKAVEDALLTAVRLESDHNRP